MNWLNKLERKFGRFSIPGLPKYIILLYVVGIMVQFAGAVQSVYAESIPYTARTSLEDFYVPSDRTVYQLVLYDFCTAVLLFYRIIAGTGLGKFPIYHVLYDWCARDHFRSISYIPDSCLIRGRV